jgi:hypothetical protein
MPSAEKAQVRDGNIRYMTIAGSVVLARRIQMRNAEERSRWPCGIPGEDVAIRVPTSNGGMVCGYCDGGKGAGFDG